MLFFGVFTSRFYNPSLAVYVSKNLLAFPKLVTITSFFSWVAATQSSLVSFAFSLNNPIKLQPFNPVHGGKSNPFLPSILALNEPYGIGLFPLGF
jgi:hypothetical protein